MPSLDRSLLQHYPQVLSNSIEGAVFFCYKMAICIKCKIFAVRLAACSFSQR